MSLPWPERIKDIRKRLGVSQQSLGTLIGVSVRSISEWERGKSSPNDLAVVLLDLLSGVIPLHSRKPLFETLRSAGPQPIPLIRALVWLERHPGLTLLPPRAE